MKTAHTIKKDFDVLAGILKTFYFQIDFTFIPVVSLDDTSPNGEGSIRRYFCGEDTGDMIPAHLLLFGEAWLMSGSKSRVLFRVAPQAITIKKNLSKNYSKNKNLKLPGCRAGKATDSGPGTCC